MRWAQWLARDLADRFPDFPSEVSVTLEPELFERLDAAARQSGLPLEWIVAAPVADTFEDSLELAEACGSPLLRNGSGPSRAAVGAN